MFGDSLPLDPRLAGGSGRYLLFSDLSENVSHRWDPATRAVSIFRTKSGYKGIGTSIGEHLVLSPDGQLAICEHS